MAKEEIDIEKEIRIILEFLNDMKKRSGILKKLVREYQESFQKTDKLEEQIRIWDRALNEFVFFNEDEDLAGERVKMISKHLMQRAKKEKVPDVIGNLMKQDRWVFDW